MDIKKLDDVLTVLKTREKKCMFYWGFCTKDVGFVYIIYIFCTNEKNIKKSLKKVLTFYL